MSDEIPELTKADFDRAMPRKVRERIMLGELHGGEDIASLRRFLGMTQKSFSGALGISVHTLRSWEHGRRTPEGPNLTLLRIAARHPRLLREHLAMTKLRSMGAWRPSLTDSNKKHPLLDFERDLPTTKEDVERLWELSNVQVRTPLWDCNRLLAPGWTMEKAMSAPLFCDDDEPFYL